MAKDDRETSGATGRISEEALERLRSRGAAERARVSMLLYTRDGVTTVPLNPDQPVTMGRSTPSDVKVRDSSLSRTHARLTLQGTDVLVEDLGSTNGTWLAGTRIERATAKPGSDMSFGAVPASIHLAAGGGDWREIDGHDTSAHCCRRHG